MFAPSSTRLPERIRHDLASASRPAALLGATGLALFLGGCANFSPDGGLASVNAITVPAIGYETAALRSSVDTDAASAKVRALLARPLTARRAVQIALLNNRELQAAYNVLGLSEAAFVQASLPPNPTFSLSRIAGSAGFEIEGKIVASILNLATLPARADIAQDRFRQAQLQAAVETLRIATEARRAFYRAVTARATARFFEQAQTAGDAAAELAKRLGTTGAMNKLDQTRNQVFRAELVAQLAGAQQRATSERERLIRALGLSGRGTHVMLPASLPPLPGKPRVIADVEAEALARRIDLQMARIEAGLLAKSRGLTNATRFISLLDAGPLAKTTHENGDTLREYGFEVELQIPLFDFGEIKVRQAQEGYMQAVNRLLAKAVTVRSEAREAYAIYRSAYDIARQYQRAVLPLRKIISDEILLRYNAMQIDVFALLSEARQRIASSNAALEAERDFWLAAVNLEAALIAGGGNNPEPTGSTAATEAGDPH